MEKKLIDEELEELKESFKKDVLPGGETALTLGIVLACLITGLCATSIAYGLVLVLLLGLAYFLYDKGVMKLSKMAEGTLITAFVLLPGFLILYMTLWGIVFAVSSVILMLL